MIRVAFAAALATVSAAVEEQAIAGYAKGTFEYLGSLCFEAGWELRLKLPPAQLGRVVFCREQWRRGVRLDLPHPQPFILSREQ